MDGDGGLIVLDVSEEGKFLIFGLDWLHVQRSPSSDGPSHHPQSTRVPCKRMHLQQPPLGIQKRADRTPRSRVQRRLFERVHAKN